MLVQCAGRPWAFFFFFQALRFHVRLVLSWGQSSLNGSPNHSQKILSSSRTLKCAHRSPPHVNNKLAKSKFAGKQSKSQRSWMIGFCKLRASSIEWLLLQGLKPVCHTSFKRVFPKPSHLLAVWTQEVEGAVGTRMPILRAPVNWFHPRFPTSSAQSRGTQRPGKQAEGNACEVVKLSCRQWLMILSFIIMPIMFDRLVIELFSIQCPK